MNDAAIAVLESAAFVLMIPGAHCKCAAARTEEGGMTDVLSPDAVSFCCIGSIYAAVYALRAPYPVKATVLETMRRMFGPITVLNDSSGLSGVDVAMKMLETAEYFRSRK